MEPLSEAALGVLRDKTIGDYLHERCCGTTVFSKLDHGQKLLDHITEQFELAGLPEDAKGQCEGQHRGSGDRG